MCYKGMSCLTRQASLLSEAQANQQEQQRQVVSSMDSPSAYMTPGSNASSNDENPRVKFLCSFSGSILPRPQDGKLRYVGGETRIVSVPRDITYEELMGKMRELFEGTTVLKYQQPDEDLDALVSVVNDDDVINMMEEYDKLGSGDGFTRLRIFLFSHSDQDGSMHFVDGDNERRYVDALNSLNESPDLRKQQLSESLVPGVVDDIHAAEQYFNQLSLDCGIHNQRSSEVHMPPIDLRHLTIPHMGSGQPQQSVTQRYNEVEASWSPMYYSPSHPGYHDPRPVAEFPGSPSSARYHTPFGELSDKNFDRLSEDYIRPQVNLHAPYDHQQQIAENVVLFPGGPVPSEKVGFPCNILHGPSGFEGNNICEQCRTTFHRNQTYPDSSWKHGEQSVMENGFHQVANPCTECHPNKEILVLNTDANMHHPFYPKEQHDPRTIYSESHNHERGWIPQHMPNPRLEEPRQHISVPGRLNDHYIIDGNGINIPHHGNLADGHHVPSHYVHHEDPRFIRVGSEMGSQLYHDQAVATGSHIHIIPLDDRGVRYGNAPFSYGPDNPGQVSHGHMASHALWRNVQNPMHGAPSYEVSCSPPVANGSVSPGFIMGTVEGSPRVQIGVENQNPWVESSQKMVGFEGSAIPEYSHGHALKLMPNTFGQENPHLLAAEPSLSPPEIRNCATATDPVRQSNSASLPVDDKLVSGSDTSPETSFSIKVTELIRTNQKNAHGAKETNCEEKVEDSIMQCISAIAQGKNPDDEASLPIHSKCSNPAEEGTFIVKLNENNAHTPLDSKGLSVDRLGFLPDLIASVKKVALEGTKEKTNGQENANHVVQDANIEGETQNESDAHGDLELDLDSESLDNVKIEPTNAEREAMEKGLQTIKNDDLEEIRELGSGTYGAVYHGKWKGSDVAIKRIKASCFAGRPSERERLIADFWKEALMLSSLHHPNVVSFYGVVRDGPDGSLATVTEFMVNGSLKQFLQKKDRTIDRRKRLIIAMDVAFGMEYLHGKNIVHFDMKCENLLVNMRDPHRPVCKIGDLGLSKVKQHTLVSGGVRGTLPWMAPELLSGKSHMVTEKIDVYSFGVVMWELLTGDEPYADMHCASIIGGIVNNTLRPQIPTWCDPEWKSLMESCWSSDPAERPSFSEISQRLRTMAAAMNVK